MVEQVVGLEFIVTGATEATAAIKRMADSQAQLTGSISKSLGITQRVENEVRKLAKSYTDGSLNLNQYTKAVSQTANAYGVFIGSNKRARSDVAALSTAMIAEANAQKQSTQAKAAAAAAIKAEAQALKDYRQARRDATAANQRYNAEAKATAQAARAVTQQEERLRLKYVQGHAAMEIYSRELNDLAMARKADIISADQQEQAVAELNIAMAKGTGAFAGVGTAAQVGGRRMNSFGMLTQQAGYQLGDFAVQVQGGTNPMVAFGQQATQMIGAFNLLPRATLMATVGIGVLRISVVALIASLGVIIPVLTAIGAYFMRTNAEAKEAGDAIGELTSSLSDYRRFSELAASSTEDLREDFGDLAEEAQALAGFFQEASAARAIDGLAASVAPFSEELSEAADNAEKLAAQIAIYGDLKPGDNNFAAIRSVKDIAIETADAFGLLPEQVIALQRELDNVQSSDTLEQMRDRSLEALQNLQAMEFAGGTIPPEIARIVQELEKVFAASARATAEIIQAEAATESVADATRDLTYEMSMAANEALRFVSNLESGGGVNAARARIAGLRAELGARQGGAGDIEAAAARAEAEVRARPEFQLALTGPEGLRQETLAGLNREVEAARLNAEAGMISSEISELGRTPDTSSGTGGASNVVDINAILDARRQQIEQERVLLGLSGQQREAQTIYFDLLKQNEDAVNSLTDTELMGAANVLAAEQEKNRVIEEGLKRQQDISNLLESSMERAFMSIVDGTMSVKDAFKAMASDIIKELYRIFVVKRITGMIANAIVPGSVNANGNAFSNGNVVPFANGGVVGSPTTFPMAGGKTGLMGEAGPEAIMPLKRGKDGKLGVAADGGGAVTVNNYFTVTANGDDSVKRIVRQQIPQIAEATKAAVVDAKRRGGSYGRAFA